MIQRQMIFWTFGLVAIFGVAVVLFLMQPPTPAKRKQVAANGRTPASLVEDAGHTSEKAAILQVMDLTVNCEAASAHAVEASVHQVRVRGDICAGKVQNVSLTNSANGFSATIFAPDEKRFATDYINLVSGENKLILQLQFENGSVSTREITINRQ